MAEQDQNQNDENHALSVIEDYDRIHAAVVETKRGRWFLDQFAKKNRHVESKILLKSLEKIETKLDNQSTLTNVANEASKLDADLQSIYQNFKLKLIAHLKWAGVDADLELSKTDTIIRFAKDQFAKQLKDQSQKLSNIIELIKSGEQDDHLLNKLTFLHSEFDNIVTLQTNIFSLLDDYMMFASKIEQLIAQNEIQINIEETLSLLNNEVVAKLRADADKDLADFHDIKKQQDAELTALKAENAQLKQDKAALDTQLVEKDSVISSHEHEIASLQQKSDDTEPLILEQSDIEPTETKVEPTEPEIISEKSTSTRLGPAARIKKIFKIEETMQAQQIQTNEEIKQESVDFDAAFKDAKLKIIDDVSSEDEVVNDAQTLIDAEAEVKAEVQTHNNHDETILSAKQKQLNSISKIMNEDLQAPDQADVQEEVKIDPIEQMADEIASEGLIVEAGYNPLNALAMLSKNERKLLYTYHH